MSNTPSTSRKHADDDRRSWLMRHWQAVLVGLYQLILLVFLLAELDVPGLAALRATNQVLLLVALLFLPFVLLASASVLRSLKLNVQGTEMEVRFADLKEKVDVTMERVSEDIAGRLGDSEEVLFTILGGPDRGAAERLRRRELLFGAKAFPSSQFLAHVMAEWTNVQVRPEVRARARWPNGSTLQNFAALCHGRIDGYVEYTSTAAQLYGIPTRGRSARAMVDALNAHSEPQHGLRWLEPLGFEDNYRVLVRKDLAEERALRSIEHLQEHAGSLAFASNSEFFSRTDGFDSLAEAYGLAFGRTEICGYDENYAMLLSGQVDVTIGWDSDRQMTHRLGFQVLEDPREHFPGYHAVPVVRIAALEAIDGLEEALRELRGTQDIEELRETVELILTRKGDRATYREFAEALVERLRQGRSTTS